MIRELKNFVKKAESQLSSIQKDLVTLIDGEQSQKTMKIGNMKKAWLGFTTSLDSHYLTELTSQPGMISNL